MKIQRGDVVQIHTRLPSIGGALGTVIGQDHNGNLKVAAHAFIPECMETGSGHVHFAVILIEPRNVAFIGKARAIPECDHEHVFEKFNDMTLGRWPGVNAPGGDA